MRFSLFCFYKTVFLIKTCYYSSAFRVSPTKHLLIKKPWDSVYDSVSLPMGTCGCTSISLCIFPQIISFLGKIVIYQEFFHVVMLLASSGNQNDNGNEKLSQQNSECAAGFLAGFFAFIAWLILSNLIEMAMRSLF